MGAEVMLPETGDLGQVIGCYQSCVWTLGRALGAHFHEKLAPELGDNWFADLKLHRKGESSPGARINLYDMSFTLSEVLEHPKSPLRDCLPREHRFYSQLEKLRRERNDWTHCTVDPNLANLKKAVARMQSVASELALPVADQLLDAIQRIDAISNGLWAANPVADPALQVEELAEAAIAALPSNGNAELDAMQLEAAQEFVEQMRPRGVSRYWTLPLPGRRLRLLERSMDIRDPQTGNSCRPEFGPNAIEKIRAWLRLVPDGGDIYLDDSGAVVASVQGILRIIGYAGELPVLHDDEMQGFLTTRQVILHDSEILIATNGTLTPLAQISANVELTQIKNQLVVVTDCGDVGYCDEGTGRWIKIGAL